MNPIIYSLLISTIAGFSTVVGGLVIFFKIKQKNINKFISFCLAFSIAIMIGISISDLIPNSFFSCLEYFTLFKTLIILVIAFLTSIIIIRYLSYKITKETTNDNLYKLGILNMLVLILHNLPEGIATFLSSYHDPSLGLKLGIAIMLHNIPEGISIAVPIYYSTGSRWQAIKKSFLSGMAEPIGAILAFIFLKQYISDLFISIILLLVGGLMITLAIQELYPKAIKYQEYKYIKLGLIIGTILIGGMFFLHK